MFTSNVWSSYPAETCDLPRVKPHGDNESSTVDVKFSPKAVLFP
jgi:hypothetical protein